MCVEELTNGAATYVKEKFNTQESAVLAKTQSPAIVELFCNFVMASYDGGI
jgi:hypothetical protein